MVVIAFVVVFIPFIINIWVNLNLRSAFGSSHLQIIISFWQFLVHLQESSPRPAAVPVPRPCTYPLATAMTLFTSRAIMISASHILFLRIQVRRHQHFNIFQPSPTSPSPLLPQVLNKRILLNSGHMLTLNDNNSCGVDGGIPGKRGLTALTLWNRC